MRSEKEDGNGPFTAKLEAHGSKLCATKSDEINSSVTMQPCISVTPDNACLKFKMPGQMTCIHQSASKTFKFLGAEEIGTDVMKPNTTCGAGVECADACLQHVNSTAKTKAPACFSLFLGNDDNVTSYEEAESLFETVQEKYSMNREFCYQRSFLPGGKER